MSEDIDTTICDLTTWVDNCPENQKEFRQAIHIILNAISNDIDLKKSMVMKGGLLMAIRYKSGRFTKDLDFSSSLSRKELNEDEIQGSLEQSLAREVAESEYDLDCRVQKCKVNPPDENATFPNIELSIGYAYIGSAKHRRLQKLQSPTIVEIDFNLNEPILGMEILEIGEGTQIIAYKLCDLVAEKLRSLLQQEVRNRYRRQDTYDLRLLIELGISEATKRNILHSLIEKARARNIEPSPKSLSRNEVKRRAERNYHTLEDEVEGELPDFNESFSIVETFYQSLPWDD